MLIIILSELKFLSLVKMSYEYLIFKSMNSNVKCHTIISTTLVYGLKALFCYKALLKLRNTILNLLIYEIYMKHWKHIINFLEILRDSYYFIILSTPWKKSNHSCHSHDAGVPQLERCFGRRYFLQKCELQKKKMIIKEGKFGDCRSESDGSVGINSNFDREKNEIIWKMVLIWCKKRKIRGWNWICR